MGKRSVKNSFQVFGLRLGKVVPLAETRNIEQEDGV